MLFHHFAVPYLVVGCAGDPAVDKLREEIVEPVPIDAESLDLLLLARRISLDVRAKYPSENELNSLENNPDELDSLIEFWMQEKAEPNY